MESLSNEDVKEERMEFNRNEKKAIKKMVKVSRKQIEKLKKKLPQDKELLDKYLEIMKQMLEVFDITNDDGTLMTEDDLMNIPINELEELVKESLKMFEKEC
jgi:septal ring factor EnvC (AmiA/AmiB activator)